ncbi:MAG: hypothetical protein KGI98_15990 [Euryarchaeota archaeon]|nr:hypothetical protein [Euryarchaeota archaeon]
MLTILAALLALLTPTAQAADLSASCSPDQVSIVCPQTIASGSTVTWSGTHTFLRPTTLSSATSNGSLTVTGSTVEVDAVAPGQPGFVYRMPNTASDGKVLDILDADNTEIGYLIGWGIGSTSPRLFQFYTNGGALELTPDGGFVGFGTAAPMTPLDVNGASSLRGDATVAGSSLTVNSGGTESMRLNAQTLTGFGTDDGATLRISNGNAAAGSTGGIRMGYGSSFDVHDPVLYGWREILQTGHSSGEAFIAVRAANTDTAPLEVATFSGSSTTLHGIVVPGSYTTAQLAPGGSAPTPGGVGGFVFNSTISDLCVSTAAASGAWALAGSKGATGCF